jgi:macrolide-specific efflux system membrane fusion protein
MLPQSRPLKILVIVLITALVALLAWKFLKPKEEKPQYITTTVNRGDIEETVLATGILQAEQLVSVGAQVSGQVKKMYVKLGDQVRQGQLIAQIDSVRQENDLRNEQAALDNLLAQKATRLAALKEARLALNRQKQMLAEDATSRAEYESAQASFETAQANVKAIDAQIEQSRLTISTARENVGYTRITAPIDGTVVAIVTEEGQTVNANQSAPTIVKLAKLQTMTIKAQVSEADVMRINKGLPVYFTTLGEPDKKIYASLRAVEPAPDSIATESSSSGSSTSSSAVYYNALFDVPNPNGDLRIDMTAQVYIVLNEAKNVLTVPAAALSMGQGRGKKAGQRGNENTSGNTVANTNGATRANTQSSAQNTVPATKAGVSSKIANSRAMVRVLDQEGNAVPRQVQVGLNNRITAEILSGLKEGEEVVIADSSDSSNNAAKRASNRPMRF